MSTNKNKSKGKTVQGDVFSKRTFFHGQTNGQVEPIPLNDTNERYARIPLVQAAQDGRSDVLEYYIRMGSNLNIPDDDGYTAVHHAARYNKISALRALAEGGANLNVTSINGMTPLHWACRYHCDDAAKFLVNKGVNVNARDKKQMTPLHYAVRKGDEELTAILVQLVDCDVNAGDEDGETALHVNARWGSVPVCRLLLGRGANIRAREISSVTPMILASAEGHIELVELLLRTAEREGIRKSVLLNDCDDEGSTSLHLAVQNGQLKVAKMLLQNGSDVNCQKANLATPLHLAAMLGFVDIIELLASHGARLDMMDSDQMTATHRAAMYNRVEIIKLLQKHGANLNNRNTDNMAPIHVACWKGHVDTVDYLLDQNVDLEIDSCLLNTLQWTVRYGHHGVLLSLLRLPEIAKRIDTQDQNDQTVLHFAARAGHSAIVKSVLECGSKPSVKDQDDRTPLHLAALHGRLEVVKCLTDASSQETNDDDMDGLTPLLLASSKGHLNVVQLLLERGADISNRDETKCTALMLAAAGGHVAVMQILLENGTEIDATDRAKNSALHFAGAAGHGECIQLLMDKGADVSIKNSHGKTALDVAVDNVCTEVVLTMLKHDRWRCCMAVRNEHGITPMDQLIIKVPQGAKLVLDNCVHRSSANEEDPNLKITFDYQYLDPGPDDPSQHGWQKYFAPVTMTQYERKELLSHPLCQSLMDQKWSRFGRYIFYPTMAFYLIFLLTLNIYSLNVVDIIKTTLVDNLYGCPIYLNANESANETLVNFYIQYGKLTGEARQLTHTAQVACQIFLRVLCVIFVVAEVIKIISQRLSYFISISNLAAVLLLVSTWLFLGAGFVQPCVYQWTAGSMALSLCWFNFIMYLRRVPYVGIYVNMLVEVSFSLLKIILIFLFFIISFAGTFFVLMRQKQTWRNYPVAMMHVLKMTLGEIDFIDEFAEADLRPFDSIIYLQLYFFIFTMPIVMMNLLVGVAVGDIGKIQKTAQLQRLCLKVDLVYGNENNMPTFIQRRLHQRKAEITPNKLTPIHKKFKKIKPILFGSPRHRISPEDPDTDNDKTAALLETLTAEVTHLRQRNKVLETHLNQHGLLLRQIAGKLNLRDTETSSYHNVKQ